MNPDLKFPEGFLWGAATSSHQVEGNNKNNDWWRWEVEGRTKEPSGEACDQYNQFRKDFALAKELGHNAHRFSLEWSRIEPEEGKFSEDALGHYKEMITVLRGLGLEPVVTINHFTLPLWFSEKGGWLSKGSEQAFAGFVEKVIKELGKEVTYWITFNEPLVYAYHSYIEGSWPPGEHSLGKAAKVFIRLLKAHSIAYKLIHRIYDERKWPAPKIGIAKYLHILTPCRRASILDVISTRLRHYYFNTLFITSLLNGWCRAPGFPVTRLPAEKTLDFIGLDYYTRDFIHFAGFSPLKIFGDVCTLVHHESTGKRNFLKWEIYPEGIYNALKICSAYNLPILITENGTCTDNDNDRVDFIKEHVRELGRAIEDGIPVFGYLYWSLIDNFEWIHGYGPKFGLIEINRATQKRAVRPSAQVFSKLIKGA